jgi:uncharacterized protein YjbI with pentapeptide repeats
MIDYLHTTDDERKQNEEATERASELIKTTNDDLTQSRTELFFFLGSIAFALLTTLSISDRDLLVLSRLQLPLLNLSMNFDAFLLGAPLLLVAIHSALLLKFSRLRAKCLAISRTLRDFRALDEQMARNLDMRVASNFLTEWLADEFGPSLRKPLSAVIYFITLHALPIVTLLIITIRTLPLHNSFFTGTQITLFAVDISLQFYLHLERRLFSAGLGCAVWLLTSLVLCVPDSWFDRLGRGIWPVKVPFASTESRRVAFGPTAFLLENGLDSATGRPVLFFSRNLIVTDEKSLSFDQRQPSLRSDAFVANSGSATPAPPSLSLRGRNLRYAKLDRSDLRAAELTLTDLTGASLEKTDLRGAVFGCAFENIEPISALWSFLSSTRSSASVPVTRANCTSFADTVLNQADLRNARFAWSQFGRPSLAGVQLQEANMDGLDLATVDLTNANLTRASLIAADLTRATLVGADLTSANLIAADLRGAELNLAALGSAELDGALLEKAQLVGADLTSTMIVGADLTEAVFEAARFRGANFWMAIPPGRASMIWADLTGASVAPLSDGARSRNQSFVGATGGQKPRGGDSSRQ